MKKKLHQKKERPVAFSAGDEKPPLPRDKDDRLRDQQAALGAMAKTMIAQLDRQDRETWEMIKRDENEPLVPGSVVWHVHQR